MLAMAKLEIAAASVPSWKISSWTKHLIIPLAKVLITPPKIDASLSIPCRTGSQDLRPMKK